MASTADVKAIFESKLKEGIPNPPGEFDPRDLEERARDEKYLKRLLKHHDNDAKLAASMLWDILIWRKTLGANDLNESTIKMEYAKEGAFFPRGRDIEGNRLLIFKAKMHVKGQKDLEELKKVIVYWFDRVEREENGKPLSLFFDMEGCGLSNMDMELIKYLINLLKLYYPNFMSYIIIYQMPWVLNAAFKVIKTLLPAKAVECMKFVSKDTLKSIVAPEQALVCWGGMDDYEFEFVPENRSSMDNTPKKVTFAEQGDNQHSPGEMLHISPHDIIIFKTENDDITGQFTLTNMDESAISFKIRTTSPEKFRVRPSSGTLSSGASQTVLIVLQPGFQVRTVTKDRFLVMSVQIPRTDLSAKELTEVWQKSSSSKVDEYRLRCQFPEKDLPRNGNIVEGKSEEKSDGSANLLNNMQANYEKLNKQIKMLKVFQVMTLTLTAIAVFFGYVIYKDFNENNGYCNRI